MAESTTNNSGNVFYGKPRVSGAVYRAPLSAKDHIPTDATTALNAAFKPMGYISEDGLTETESRSVENLKAWGGSTVATSQTEYGKQYKFACLENNENVFKARYGDGNVTVSGDSITVKHTSKELEDGIWVFEMALGADKVLRKVLPNAKPTEFDDITYTDSDAIKYGLTLTALPVNNEYAIDYIAKVSAGE